MKTKRNILAAFLFNLTFSILEIGGGILTGTQSACTAACTAFSSAVAEAATKPIN